MSQPQVSILLQKISKDFKVRGNKAVFKGLFDPQWEYVNALSNLDLIIRDGESVAFLGPNGAGKTTSIKIMTGLMYPSGGEVEVLGYTPRKRQPEFLRQIGLVLGNKAGLNWDLSATQSFQLLKSIYQVPDDQFMETVDQLAELLKVKQVLNRQVRQLSLGERMKIELIGAVLHRPKVLFLDEPTIGLDVDAKVAVRGFVRYLQQEFGTTILLTSHDMTDVAHICDRAVIISHGKKVYDNTLAALEAEYSTKKVIEFYTTTDSTKGLPRGFTKLKNNHYRVNVDKVNLKNIINELTSNSNVDDIQIESINLETIMSEKFATS